MCERQSFLARPHSGHSPSGLGRRPRFGRGISLGPAKSSRAAPSARKRRGPSGARARFISPRRLDLSRSASDVAEDAHLHRGRWEMQIRRMRSNEDVLRCARAPNVQHGDPARSAPHPQEIVLPDVLQASDCQSQARRVVVEARLSRRNGHFASGGDHPESGAPFVRWTREPSNPVSALAPASSTSTGPQGRSRVMGGIRRSTGLRSPSTQRSHSSHAPRPKRTCEEANGPSPSRNSRAL